MSRTPKKYRKKPVEIDAMDAHVHKFHRIPLGEIPNRSCSNCSEDVTVIACAACEVALCHECQ
jgi:hypothetical protein